MRRGWTPDRTSGRPGRGGSGVARPPGLTAVVGDPAGPGRPRRGIVVLTCMDARIAPLRLLGLSAGDAQVLRNAGGLVTEDVLRSLRLSCRQGGVREAIVLRHRRCLALPDEDDLVPGIARTVARLSSARGMALRVRGCVLDHDTGLVSEVITRGSQR